MSKKTDLITVLMEYKGKYENLQAQLLKIQQNPDTTPQGQEKKTKEALDVFAPTVKLYHDKAVEIIDTGLEALESKWRKNSTGKLSDGGYQAGLSNVIKMLELGAIQNRDDLQNIVDTYKDDFNALAIIEKVMKQNNSNLSEMEGVIIPPDNREYNKRLLNQLRGNVDQYISDNSLKFASRSWNVFNQGLVNVSTTMDSLVDFITTRLGNDLELIH